MHGRVALITGGASGIGRAIGEAMAAGGATVVLADRQRELAGEVARGISERGGKAQAVELDVRDADAFREVAEDVRGRHRHIDYFFNNAGIMIGGEIADYERDTFDRLLDVNVRGVGYGIDAVYPIMREQGVGHIVNTASVAGLIGIAGVGGYTATKHAVVGLSKVLRVEAARYGVRVSALCPGAIRTPIVQGGAFGGHVGDRLDEQVLERLADRLEPMDVNEFAKVVLADVERNEPYIVVPRFWKALWLVERVAPRLTLRIWELVHARALHMLEQAASGEASSEPAPAAAST